MMSQSMGDVLGMEGDDGMGGDYTAAEREMMGMTGSTVLILRRRTAMRWLTVRRWRLWRRVSRNRRVLA